MPSSPNKKHPQNSKKAKTIQRQKQGIVRNVDAQPVMQENTAVVSQPSKPAVKTRTAETAGASVPVQADTIRYPYLSGELKRIGILAAAIIIVLIVLAVTIG